MKNRKLKTILITAIALLLTVGCTKKSTKKQILSFKFISPDVETIIDEDALENQKINIGKYQIDINSKQVDCELKISSDSTYEIQLCFQATEDIVNCAILSYGHYSIANELLYLHDDFYGYDWDISFSDNGVSVGRGYAFLNGKAMKYQNETVEVLPPDDNYLARTRAQFDMFVTHQNNPQFVTGQYEGQNHEYLLRIDDIGKYQLYLKDVLLSEGSWSRQDNILILHDVQLNYDFKIAIGNESLLTLGIPGEFGGTMFYLESNQNNF